MPMMLAQEASIIDIIGVPFLLPKFCGAVLVFEAVLAGAPHRACVQNGACKDAHDALTEGGLERSKTLPVLGFPYENAFLGRSRAALPGEKRRSHEARSAALCARSLLLRRPFMARALAGHQKGRACAARFKSLRLRPPTPTAIWPFTVHEGHRASRSDAGAPP